MAIVWMGLTSTGSTLPFDCALMVDLRALAETAPAWVTSLFRFATWLGDADRRTPLILLGAVVLLVQGRRWPAAALIVGSLAATITASTLLKPLFARPRPDIVSWWTAADGYSLPSGHATGAVAFALMIWLLTANFTNRPMQLILRAFAIAITLTIGVSRLYLGVHWPSDVIAGWLWGTAVASLSLAAIPKRN